MSNLLRLYTTFLLAFVCNVGLATDYYIDAYEGNDSNNGTSESSAWKTLANINTTDFQPGDSILFKAGQSWTGTIKPQGSGTAGNPIVIGKYGSGDRPAIHGDASVNCTVEPGETKYCTVYLYNQEYWEIRDLEITNYDSSEEGGISLQEWENANVTNYANVTKPDKYAGVNSQKCGILVEANDFGEVNHLHFENLEVHGVNGDISEKNNGGIFFKIFNFDPSDTPTYFNDLLVDNCHFHDIDRTGVSNRSDYDNRTLNRNTDWTPSKNVVISNNIFERTGANALIVRVAEDPLMENNLFDHCSIKETGNAAFNFNTDGAIWQFNEARFTKYNVGDIDAGGIDSDYRTKDTTIQYNYIHDNDFGTLITGGPSTYNAFNDGTIFRYNILENDGLLKTSTDGAWAFKISGLATNTEIYNNIIYVGTSKAYTDIVYHKSWSGWPNKTTYTNNIFFNEGSNTSFNLGSSKNNTFSNNIYYGNAFSNEPSDPNKITSDPLLTNPGNGESGYQLQSGSPALAAGLRLSTSPDKDYYQNTIQSNASIDIGIDQVTGQSVGDTDPPTPNPPTFAVAPVASNSSSIIMTATLGRDQSGPVEYYFEETSGYPGGTDSGWQTSESYTDNGLSPETTYRYRVRMRDSWGNIGDYSSSASVTTLSSGGGGTTEKILVAEDAYVRGGSHANTNYGTNTALKIKESSNRTYARKSILKFDLSAFTSIASAQLFIYGSAQQVMDIDAYKVYPDNWSENTVTWNNAPSFTSFAGSTVVGTSDKWHQIDVTSAAQDEMVGNKTFSIGLKDDAVAIKTINLFSKENAQSQFKPYLIVDGNTDIPPGGGTNNQVNINVEQDSYIRGGSNSNKNYGTESSLVVKESRSNNKYSRISYLNFNLSSVSGMITSAKLHIHGRVSSGSSFDVDVYETDDNWEETTIKWNNAPSISSNLGSFSVRGGSVTEYIVDITPYVQGEQSGDGYVSIVLKDDSKTKGKFVINSKESGSDIAFLEIEYEVAANPISHH